MNVMNELRIALKKARYCQIGADGMPRERTTPHTVKMTPNIVATRITILQRANTG